MSSDRDLGSKVGRSEVPVYEVRLTLIEDRIKLDIIQPRKCRAGHDRLVVPPFIISILQEDES